MPLNSAQVRTIRTANLPDTHFATLYKVTRGTVRAARIGDTWANHSTPPDVAPREKRGGRSRQRP